MGAEDKICLRKNDVLSKILSDSLKTIKEWL